VPVSCYGKLPFHREFLRAHLTSPAAPQVVRWLEETHDAISRAGSTITESECVTFVAPSPGNGVVVTGIVRQSSDGQRKHPLTLFVESSCEIPSHRWHLLPLALAETWAALRDLSSRSFADVHELTVALAEAPPTVDLDAAEQRYRDATSTSCSEGPWRTLTGANDDLARHLAFQSDHSSQSTA
jgi:type VI secretion system ImpM family protein